MVKKVSEIPPCIDCLPWQLKKTHTHTILEKIRKLRIILRSRFIQRRRGKNRRRNCEGKRELKKQEENHGYTLQNQIE